MPFPVGVEVRKSEVAGRGLFATEDIPKGTITWRMTGEGQNLCVDGNEGSANVAWSKEELEKLGESDPNALRTVLHSGYPHFPSGYYIQLRDGGQFTNHSKSFNQDSEWQKSWKDEYSFATRDIKAGEEITDDYGNFPSLSVPWLSELFKKYCPDRFALEVDADGPQPKIPQEAVKLIAMK